MRYRWAALPLALLALACGEDEPLGSVMLAITTDMYIDKDLSRVDIIIQPESGLTQNAQFNLFPALDGRFLPGTVAIIEGSTPGEFIRVRIIARQENFVRVVREAALRVPRRRTALLSMPLQWLCDGHVDTTGQLPRSSCPEGETCSRGACVPDAIDEAALPDYEPEDVFGGGNAAGGGTCFDTEPCFDDSIEPALDTETCVLDTEVSDDLNIGIRLPLGSDGHCTNSECWIPIDASPETGWTALDGGSRVQLPPAVCEHVRGGDASVRVSHLCPSKAEGSPTCGPWTLVGTEPGGGGDIDGAPLTVTNLSLATSLEARSTRLGREVARACAAITQASPPAEPTPAEITSLCTAARETIVALAPLDWYHVTTRCWPDADSQLACELACDENCDPGNVQDRCDSATITGRCDDVCNSRECLGTSTKPVDFAGACDGTCSGQCTGTCVGQCDGTCANVGADGYCAGACDGTCTGLCQGRCGGTCQGSNDGDPNLPVAACGQGTQCRGGCAGEYSGAVCHSPLTASPCGLDEACEADCRSLGAIGVACEPSLSWFLPKAGLDAALRTSIGEAFAELVPVRDVEGPALLLEAARIAQSLQDTAMAGDPVAASRAAGRVRDAAEILRAAAQGASAIINAAGEPRDTPGGGEPDPECMPTVADGSMPLIDNFEDGNGQVLIDEGRDGFWHVVRDNSAQGQLSLDEPPLPDGNGAVGSSSAMHLSGSDFTEWGAGFSVDLRQEGRPYDASAYAGLKFWARGTPSLRLIAVQQNLATGNECSTCTSADCGSFYRTQVPLTDTWAEFSIPWGMLAQSPAGTTAFAPDQLMQLEFEAPATEDFEFWLDELSFF